MSDWGYPLFITYAISYTVLIGLIFLSLETLKINDKQEFKVLGGKEGYSFLYMHPVWLIYMSYFYVLFGRYKNRGISRDAISIFNITRTVAIINTFSGLSYIFL